MLAEAGAMQAALLKAGSTPPRMSVRCFDTLDAPLRPCGAILRQITASKGSKGSKGIVNPFPAQVRYTGPGPTAVH